MNQKPRSFLVLWCFCFLAFPMTGCEKKNPEDKIRRWATEVWTKDEAPRATLERLTLDMPQEAPHAMEPDLRLEDKAVVQVDACGRVIAFACDALGIHTEECLEARSHLPTQRGEELLEGCEMLLQKYVADPKASKGKACWMLENRVCKVFGSRSPECVYTRADMRRLSKDGKTKICLGDLLVWEARQLFSSIPSGNGK